MSRTLVFAFSIAIGLSVPFISFAQTAYYGLSCMPGVQTVTAGTPAVFTATGGVGIYSWATADRTYVSVGPRLSVVLQTLGPQIVTVTSGVQTAQCSVNVVGGTTYAPPVSAYPSAPLNIVLLSAPSLPNTGFPPISSATLAFMIVLLIALTVATYPYAKKTAATFIR